ncbi:hypothetical protein ABZ619_22190 [Streptomyces sp. NPDC007851]|uniref:hypothetical protein n=1 Tax=Streptomyces sp. NPDC007851 TaxID=3155008 RepID=UPI0033D2F742
MLQRMPFQVQVVRTDNGTEFQCAFHWHVLDKAIARAYMKLRTPRLNGKVEPSYRIDAEEFYQLLDGVMIGDAEVFNDKLGKWEDYDNYHRPHGGLGGQTPYERLKQKTTAEAASAIVSGTPSRLLRPPSWPTFVGLGSNAPRFRRPHTWKAAHLLGSAIEAPTQSHCTDGSSAEPLLRPGTSAFT